MVTGEYQFLLEHRRLVSGALASQIDTLTDDHPSLASAIIRLVDHDKSAYSPFRLLPFPILGALTSDPGPALNVAVLSRLWWTGAEVFDDLTDGAFDGEGAGLSAAQAFVSSSVCLTLVPHLIIEQQDIPTALRVAWGREFAISSLQAAEGQLNDLSGSTSRVTWGTVMRTYAGKSGAPYGRDAAMTAMLAGLEGVDVEGWRAFGRLFGVLRQMANDRASKIVGEEEDLTNGTWTLLLALAMEEAGPEGAVAFSALRTGARQDGSSRRELLDRLAEPSLTGSYNNRIAIIRDKLSELLRTLAKPSEYRDLIHLMIDMSATTAYLFKPADAK